MPAARVTWLCALFLCCYVGIEVAIGGWVVTFMLRVRHGANFASGMTETGFWLGITVGRVVLGFVTGRIGERLAISVSDLEESCLAWETCFVLSLSTQRKNNITTQHSQHRLTHTSPIDLPHSRHNIPPSLLARPLLPRLRRLRVTSRSLPSSSIPRRNRCRHSPPAQAPTRLRYRLCCRCGWRRCCRVSVRCGRDRAESWRASIDADCGGFVGGGSGTVARIAEEGRE